MKITVNIEAFSAGAAFAAWVSEDWNAAAQVAEALGQHGSALRYRTRALIASDRAHRQLHEAQIMQSHQASQ